MVCITFPDGSLRQFDDGVIGLDIAKYISNSLAKKAIAIRVNGLMCDLTKSINADSNVEIITPEKNDEILDLIRHDAAHILAQAVKRLYPKAQVTIGPAIKDGFYYDFADVEPFSEDDLLLIEKEMQKITQAAYRFEREVWTREKSIAYFSDIGEHYKVEIIQDLPENEEITVYKQGDFLDLCRGPHTPDTSKIKYYKLLKVAGAFWRGDSNNEMLQRIYGTAWESEKSLKNYLQLLEEAEKRDHRKLGKEMELFHIQGEAVGSIFWHEKGYSIFREIENYIRGRLSENGYKEIKTPLLIDKELWKKSGHWDKFREHMFIAESEGRSLALKPMNCPGHIQIFNSKLHSYRDLPIRLSEFGCCHRNEPSGALHGLMRVRGFTQDDAHIFCTEEQIISETENFINLLLSVYKDFGFTEVKIKFSDRPEKRAGSDEVWDKAESSLKSAIDHIAIEYTINKGEGAFYGPKLEFILTDAIGRDWQCGTLQLDFVLPERLGAFYIEKDGAKHIPVMIHRAILGSFERFIGILIEQYGGKFPLWLNPIQVVVTCITDKVNKYAEKLYKYLLEYNIKAEIDLTSEKISYKLRKHMVSKIPYVIIVGEKEQENNTVSIRKLGSKEQFVMLPDEFKDKLLAEIRDKVIGL